jgi:multidrug resistance protein
MTQRLSLRRLWVLMATVFVDMLGFLMVMPLLPFYTRRLGGDATTVGLLVAAFSFAQLATSPFWGRLSDRYGRRPMLLVGLAGSAIAYVLFGLADSIWLLFASRLAQGAGGGTTGVAQAYVTDTVSAEERAKALGWLSAATSAGVMIGPALGSFAARFGNAAPGYFAAGLCLLNVIFAWWFLPESNPAVRAAGTAAAPVADAGRSRPSLRENMLDVLAHPLRPVNILIWMYALGMMAFFAMNAVLALFLADRFGVNEHTIGWFYVYVGTVSLVMRSLILGPAVKRFGEVGILRWGVVSLTLGLALLPFSTSIWAFGAAVLLVPIGTALLFPATSSLVSRFAPAAMTGQILGVQQAFGGIARMVGPAWSGVAFSRIGFPAPFWIGSGLMAGVGLLALRLDDPRRQPASEPDTAPT